MTKRRRHRQQNTTAQINPLWLAWQVALAADAPISESLVPAGLFEQGIGNLVFSRSLPDGRIALSVFLLDVFCLGVKDAFFAVWGRDDYAARLRVWPDGENLQRMQPACFRKLVEGGVEYARGLGFKPHNDYALACGIFGDVEATACSSQFEYGHEGKPYYISGPNETPARAAAIVKQLERRLGEGKFHFLVAADPSEMEGVFN
jgi:hypothetical protein